MKGEHSPAFIHSALDDYGLTPSQFRVYCHIARRSNGLKGSCYENLAGIAKACGLSKDTVQPCVQFLAKQKLIALTRHPGCKDGDEFRLLPVSEWAPPPGKTPPSENFTPVNYSPLPPGKFPCHPPENFLCTYIEGTPEGNPKKDIAADAAVPSEIELWNSKPDLPKVSTITKARRDKLRARRKDPFFMENYPAALERIAKSDFCLGKNNHGWRADFDWILQPDTIVKILEGRYDNRAAPALIPPHIRQAAIEKLIASHPANPNSTRYTFDAKPEQKAELIRLKSEHEALNRRIALNIS